MGTNGRGLGTREGGMRVYAVDIFCIPYMKIEK
jgi:hypothetical protein